MPSLRQRITAHSTSTTAHHRWLVTASNIITCAALTSCTSQTPANQLAEDTVTETPHGSSDPSRLINALSGTWDNSAQYLTVAPALKVPPSVNGDWLDLQHAFFKPIVAPAIGNNVLYLEWRNKAADGTIGAISRQRIWSFKTDANNILRMNFYAFVDGNAWSINSIDFAALQKDALRNYSDACALYFTQTASTFKGEITSKDCSITAASGRRMGINAQVTLRADGILEYRESGTLDDGRFAFRVPPTRPYQFLQIAK